MTSTGIVLILVGLFIVINSNNLVGLLKGNLKINQTPTVKSSTSAAPAGQASWSH